jgi:hypothetical protein
MEHPTPTAKMRQCKDLICLSTDGLCERLTASCSMLEKRRSAPPLQSLPSSSFASGWASMIALRLSRCHMAASEASIAPPLVDWPLFQTLGWPDSSRVALPDADKDLAPPCCTLPLRSLPSPADADRRLPALARQTAGDAPEHLTGTPMPGTGWIHAWAAPAAARHRSNLIRWCCVTTLENLIITCLVVW